MIEQIYEGADERRPRHEEGLNGFIKLAVRERQVHEAVPPDDPEPLGLVVRHLACFILERRL